MSEANRIVYVQLLNEGTPTWRPTSARFIEGDIYELLATTDHDPEGEEWEFIPGTIVHCELRKTELVATKQASSETK